MVRNKRKSEEGPKVEPPNRHNGKRYKLKFLGKIIGERLFARATHLFKFIVIGLVSRFGSSDDTRFEETSIITGCLKVKMNNRN